MAAAGQRIANHKGMAVGASLFFDFGNPRFCRWRNRVKKCSLPASTKAQAQQAVQPVRTGSKGKHPWPLTGGGATDADEEICRASFDGVGLAGGHDSAEPHDQMKLHVILTGCFSVSLRKKSAGNIVPAEEVLCQKQMGMCGIQAFPSVSSNRKATA